MSSDLSNPDVEGSVVYGTGYIVGADGIANFQGSLEEGSPPAGSGGFFAGNSKFITRKLWGTANEPPFFHHGKFTTLREAVLVHAGEALASRQAFEALSEYEQDSIIEFLKTLQVLPPGTKHLVVDENYKKKEWPPDD